MWVKSFLDMRQENIGVLFLKDRPTLILQDKPSYEVYKTENNNFPVLEVKLPEGDLFRIIGPIQSELRKRLTGSYSDKGYQPLGSVWGGVLEFEESYSKERGLADLKAVLNGLEKIVIKEE
jgi:hypothetical protein